ncbi:MAG: hypothetical protein HC799_19935 [Limnothrix sp. RL_2_0]|nr:hypothetical protein [Limnothrix sp. RL_2_0]
MNKDPLPKSKTFILYVLCELYTPISCQSLAETAQQPGLDVQQVLDDWKQFLHQEYIKGQLCYSLYHSSFRDFLQNTGTLQAAGFDLTDINGAIADNFWKFFYDD